MDRQEFKILLNYLEINQEHLNTLQNEFINSLKGQYETTGVLTKRQVEFLYDLKEYLGSINLESDKRDSEPDRYAAQYSSFDHSTTFNLRT
jgi:hypothetical protein